MVERRIMTVVGARPQFVKAAMLSRALARIRLEEILVHTGQHYDDALSGSFFRTLAIPPPQFNLEAGSGSHGVQTARMLERLEACMIAERPDIVAVFGDTNSTLAASLAAAKLAIPLAHIEAGLRSGDHRQPEEINRIVADRLSWRLYTPTAEASAMLLGEGIPAGSIIEAGDLMVDAALAFSAEAGAERLAPFSVQPGGYVFATIHRAENTDDPARLGRLIAALDRLAGHLPVVFCAHPRTAARLTAFGLAPGRCSMHPAADYLTSLCLSRHAAVVLTDSGGIQKEAAILGVPVVVLRPVSEWQELVRLGWCSLLASDADACALALASLGRPGAPLGHLYGSGHAAQRMADDLQSAELR